MCIKEAFDLILYQFICNKMTQFINLRLFLLIGTFIGINGDSLLSFNMPAGTTTYVQSWYKTNLAVNGDHCPTAHANTYTVVYQRDGKQAGWYVDLIYKSRISLVKIWTRNIAGDLSYLTLKVGPTLEDLKECGLYTSKNHPAEVVEIKCIGTGRFVYIERSHNLHLAFMEVEVFGEKLPIGATEDRIISYLKPTGTHNAVRNYQTVTNFANDALLYFTSTHHYNCAYMVRRNLANYTNDWFVNFEMTAQVSHVKLMMPEDCCDRPIDHLIIKIGHSFDDMSICFVQEDPYFKGTILKIDCQGVGRYLSISSPANELVLCHVEVYGHKVSDTATEFQLAHNKPTGTLSATLDINYRTHYANDGNYDQSQAARTCSGTKKVGAQYPNWYVNLGKTAKINRIIMYTPKSGYAPVIKDMYIKTGPSVDILKECNRYAGPAKQAEVLTIPCNATAQYVYLEIPSTNYFIFCEVEVWGNFIKDSKDELISMGKPTGTMGCSNREFDNFYQLTDGNREVGAECAYGLKVGTTPANLYIDLGAKSQISRIEVLFRNAYMTYNKDIIIKVGDDRENLVECARMAGIPKAGEERSFECNAIGRFVWLESATTQIHLCEVEVYGKTKKECLEKPASGHQYNYEGSISQTKSGHKCQRWDTNSPHKVSSSIVSSYSAQELKELENYCRQPKGDNEPEPWCYTTTPEVRWELCSIPHCH